MPKIYSLGKEGLNEPNKIFEAFGPLLILYSRPTNHSNDNIALLEAGFNKEISKNTTLLLKQEKEQEVFQAIRELLEKEAANELHPEAEATNPAFKIYLQFKTENVSFRSQSVQIHVT